MLALSLLVAMNPSVQIREVEMVALNKKEVDLGSVVVSPDLTRWAYSTLDQRTVIVDGKRFTGYNKIGAVKFSGDSKNWGCAAIPTNANLEQKGYLLRDGKLEINASSIMRVLRAGLNGGLCWMEQSREGVRIVNGSVVSDWADVIERIDFEDDGQSYMAYCRKRKLEKEAQPDGKEQIKTVGYIDYFLLNGTERIDRERRIQFFVAPKTRKRLEVFDLGSREDRNQVVWGSEISRLHGEIKGQAIFSDSGRSYVIRSEFTAATPQGNQARVTYHVNGVTVTDLTVQTGFAFYPGQEKFVVGGYAGKDAALYLSDKGLVKYADLPGLHAAPNEPFRAVRFINSKLVLLFQSKRTSPALFVEGVGVVSTSASNIVVDSLSPSPDGKWLAFAAERDGVINCYLMDIEHQGEISMIGKQDYQFDVDRAAKPIWKSNNELTFLGLRAGKLIRFEAKLN